MKKVVRLTENDITRLVKRVLSEQNETDTNMKWNNFVKVMMTMQPKPTHDVFKTGQSLNWGNRPNLKWNMSILKGDEEFPKSYDHRNPTSLMVAVNKSNMDSLKEMINFFKVKGYRPETSDKGVFIDIPVTKIDFEKVKNDVTQFFKTFHQ